MLLFWITWTVNTELNIVFTWKMKLESVGKVFSSKSWVYFQHPLEQTINKNWIEKSIDEFQQLFCWNIKMEISIFYPTSPPTFKQHKTKMFDSALLVEQLKAHTVFLVSPPVLISELPPSGFLFKCVEWVDGQLSPVQFYWISRQEKVP